MAHPSGEWQAAQSIFKASPCGFCANNGKHPHINQPHNNHAYLRIKKRLYLPIRFLREVGCLALYVVSIWRTILPSILPIGVASIAGRTHILVAVYIFMVIGHFRWIIMLMAFNAAKQGVISWRGMALGALVPFVPVPPTEYGEVLVVMIPRGRCPSRFRMAVITTGWELRRRMVGVIGVVVVGCMASETSIGRIAKVAPNVAGRTVVRYVGMRPIERIKSIVVKISGHPSVLCVAVVASRREGRRRMIRVGCSVVISDMATRARIRCVVEIAPNMASRTFILYHRMRPVERIKSIVVKIGRHPSGFGMAVVAGHREARRRVVGFRSGVEVIGVAARTRIWCVVEITTNMARRTVILYRRVRPVERVKSIMVKIGGCPSRLRMAAFAICRERRSRMVRVRRRVVI